MLVLKACAEGCRAELFAVYAFATEGVAVAVDMGGIGAGGVGEGVVVEVGGVFAHHVQLHLLPVGHAVGVEEVELGQVVLLVAVLLHGLVGGYATVGFGHCAGGVERLG